MKRFDVLSHLVQLGLCLSTLLVRCQIVLPHYLPNTSLMVLSDDALIIDLGLDRFEILFQRHIAKERDVMTALTAVLTLKVLVLILARLEDDMARGNEK